MTPNVSLSGDVDLANSFVAEAISLANTVRARKDALELDRLEDTFALPGGVVVRVLDYENIWRISIFAPPPEEEEEEEEVPEDQEGEKLYFVLTPFKRTSTTQLFRDLVDSTGDGPIERNLFDGPRINPPLWETYFNQYLRQLANSYGKGGQGNLTQGVPRLILDGTTFTPLGRGKPTSDDVVGNWYWFNPWQGYALSWTDKTLYYGGQSVTYDTEVVAAWRYQGSIYYMLQPGELYKVPAGKPFRGNGTKIWSAIDDLGWQNNFTPGEIKNLRPYNDFEFLTTTPTEDGYEYEFEPYIAPNGRVALIFCYYRFSIYTHEDPPQRNHYLTIDVSGEAVSVTPTENSTYQPVEVSNTSDLSEVRSSSTSNPPFGGPNWWPASAINYSTGGKWPSGVSTQSGSYDFEKDVLVAVKFDMTEEATAHNYEELRLHGAFDYSINHTRTRTPPYAASDSYNVENNQRVWLSGLIEKELGMSSVTNERRYDGLKNYGGQTILNWIGDGGSITIDDKDNDERREYADHSSYKLIDFPTDSTALYMDSGFVFQDFDHTNISYGTRDIFNDEGEKTGWVVEVVSVNISINFRTTFPEDNENIELTFNGESLPTPDDYDDADIFGRANTAEAPTTWNGFTLLNQRPNYRIGSAPWVFRVGIAEMARWRIYQMGIFSPQFGFSARTTRASLCAGIYTEFDDGDNPIAGTLRGISQYQRLLNSTDPLIDLATLISPSLYATGEIVGFITAAYMTDRELSKLLG